MERITLTVKGMTCQHCVMTVTDTLKGLPGVRAAEVTLETGQARVTFDPAQVSREVMAQAVSERGYEVGLPAV